MKALMHVLKYTPVGLIVGHRSSLCQEQEADIHAVCVHIQT